jgi:ABC-type branched-subunit amino acid transport system substrate-binding protein
VDWAGSFESDEKRVVFSLERNWGPWFSAKRWKGVWRMAYALDQAGTVGLLWNPLKLRDDAPENKERPKEQQAVGPIK